MEICRWLALSQPMDCQSALAQCIFAKPQNATSSKKRTVKRHHGSADLNVPEATAANDDADALLPTLVGTYGGLIDLFKRLEESRSDIESKAAV